MGTTVNQSGPHPYLTKIETLTTFRLVSYNLLTEIFLMKCYEVGNYPYLLVNLLISAGSLWELSQAASSVQLEELQFLTFMCWIHFSTLTFLLVLYWLFKYE